MIDAEKNGRAAVPAGVPSLDALAVDPSAADALPSGALAALMLRALSVVGVLQARITARAAVSATTGSTERMLSRQEVAQRLGVSVSFIEKHLDALPPRRSIAGMPAWREADVNKWLRDRPIYRMEK